MNLPMSFRGACDEESRSFARYNTRRIRFFTSLRFVQNDILLGILRLPALNPSEGWVRSAWDGKLQRPGFDIWSPG